MLCNECQQVFSSHFISNEDGLYAFDRWEATYDLQTQLSEIKVRAKNCLICHTCEGWLTSGIPGLNWRQDCVVNYMLAISARPSTEPTVSVALHFDQKREPICIWFRLYATTAEGENGHSVELDHT